MKKKFMMIATAVATAGAISCIGVTAVAGSSSARDDARQSGLEESGVEVPCDAVDNRVSGTQVDPNIPECEDMKAEVVE